MHSLSKVVLIAYLFSFTFVFPHTFHKKTGPIPIDILFNDIHRKLVPLISPDGTHIVYAKEHKKKINLWIRSLKNQNDFPITHDASHDIKRYMWLLDSSEIVYLQDIYGDENFKLYGVKIDTGDITCYTPFDLTAVKDIFYTYDPRRIVISLNLQDKTSHDLYSLDLTTKELTLIEQNPGDVSQWVVTLDGACIARKRLLEDSILLEVKQEDIWSQYEIWHYEDNSVTLQDSMPILLHTSSDAKNLYMLDSKGLNATALVKKDLKSNEREVIAYDDNFDIAPFFFNFETYEVLAPTYLVDFSTNTVAAAQRYKERAEWLCYDEAIAIDLARIAKFDDGDLYITSRDSQNNQWVIRFVSDDKPDRFWLYNRESQSATFLFNNHDEIMHYQCAKTEPIAYTARDGFTIHGYLTKALYPREDKPLILYVHGGPWIRDIWSFNAITQYFASRGYAVLQPNFRGSVGYGTEFIQAGNREWGKKMYDDLIDGVQWAIKEGYAHPSKVVIFGVSFGGYAALQGATQSSDVFCCAVDISGISDVDYLFKTFCPYYKGFLKEAKYRVGSSKEELDSCSPIYFAQNIQIPLLIVQGSHDRRVVQGHADMMVNELDNHGKEYEYLFFENEGHGLPSGKSKILFFHTLEKFLHMYVG